jgi:UDP-N-acetylglucosamine acyltransferase
MTPSIHPTAIVADGATIGAGSVIGPFSIIGPQVQIGKNNQIGPHVVIDGFTTVGDDNRLFQFSSIGAPPQDLKFRGEPSRLEIGNGNTIREFVTLQPGTEGGGMVTQIGDRNLFMSSAHIAHDVIVGSGCVFANSAAVAGHVVIGDRVTVGGMVGIHQFVRIGDYAMIGAGSMVAKDVPPFSIAQGDRAGLAGINKIGLERAGFSDSDIAQARSVFRKLFLGAGTWQERLTALTNSAVGNEDSQGELVKLLLDFVRNSERGVCSMRSRQGEEG